MHKRNKMNTKRDRRRFIGNMLGAATVATVGLPFDTLAAGRHPKVAGKTDFTAPYLQHLTPNRVSVGTIDLKAAVSWLELNDGATVRKIINNKDGLTEVGTGLKIYTITGLQPGKTYRYRILRKEITDYKTSFMKFADTVASQEYRFTTPVPDADTVSCLILNDIHDRPHSFNDLISLNREPYDFVVLNGDMFDEQHHEQQLIDHLLAPVSEIFATEKPFIMVRGNHETRGKFSIPFKNYFVYPEDRYYYNFQQGPVNFTILDTGEDKRDDHPYYAGLVSFDAFRLEQAAWLEKLMNTRAYRRSPFKVILMHIPPYHSGGEHGTLHCREVFAPLFDKYQPDVVISGHVHRHGIFMPREEHSFPLIIGGGPLKGERTLIRLSASRQALNISMINDEGAEVGKFEVTK